MIFYNDTSEWLIEALIQEVILVRVPWLWVIIKIMMNNNNSVREGIHFFLLIDVMVHESMSKVSCFLWDCFFLFFFFICAAEDSMRTLQLLYFNKWHNMIWSVSSSPSAGGHFKPSAMAYSQRFDSAGKVFFTRTLSAQENVHALALLGHSKQRRQYIRFVQKVTHPKANLTIFQHYYNYVGVVATASRRLMST